MPERKVRLPCYPWKELRQPWPTTLERLATGSVGRQADCVKHQNFTPRGADNVVSFSEAPLSLALKEAAHSQRMSLWYTRHRA